MKTETLVSLLLMMWICAPVVAQADTGLSQVTLYWYSPGQSIDPEKTDRSRSAVNFETGERGAADGQHDLRYGGIAIGANDGKLLADWLGVLDCRNMIVELGVKQWRNFKETPPFPQPKTEEAPLPPGNGPRCAVGEPYRQFVAVNPGHMYLMRVLHGQKVKYVMFRIESFVSRDNCVLSWKLVKPPNVPDDEK